MLPSNNSSGNPWGGGQQDPPHLKKAFHTILQHFKKILIGSGPSSFFLHLLFYFFLHLLFYF